jgi:hypothetical protein
MSSLISYLFSLRGVLEKILEKGVKPIYGILPACNLYDIHFVKMLA